MEKHGACVCLENWMSEIVSMRGKRGQRQNRTALEGSLEWIWVWISEWWRPGTPQPEHSCHCMRWIYSRHGQLPLTLPPAHFLPRNRYYLEAFRVLYTQSTHLVANLQTSLAVVVWAPKGSNVATKLAPAWTFRVET